MKKTNEVTYMPVKAFYDAWKLISNDIDEWEDIADRLKPYALFEAGTQAKIKMVKETIDLYNNLKKKINKCILKRKKLTE